MRASVPSSARQHDRSSLACFRAAAAAAVTAKGALSAVMNDDTLTSGRSSSTHAATNGGAHGAQGYRVLHRPWAFVQWLPYAAKLPEDYVLMAEPDHIFLHIPPLWCVAESGRWFSGAAVPRPCARQDLFEPSSVGTLTAG